MRHLVIYEFTKAILDRDKPLRRAYFNEFILTFNKIKLYYAFLNRAEFEYLSRDETGNNVEYIMSNLSSGNIRRLFGRCMYYFPNDSKETPLFVAPVNCIDRKFQWGIRILILTKYYL